MAITWDELGERRYDTGIDRGVLYPQDGTPPVAWNGLISVAESQGQEVTAKYIDGVKYFEYSRGGIWSAKLRAITYPDKLEQLTGQAERVNGVYLHDQQLLPFHLAYRTMVGNPVQGVIEYKLHIIYNVLARISDHTYETMGAQLTPQPFDWDLTSTPLQINGIRPLSHISFASRRVDPISLASIEGAMYEGVHADPLHALGGSEAFIDSVVATP